MWVPSDWVVAGFDDMPSLLPEADVVVLLVPYTAETKALADRDVLARMKDGALLVNAARGAVVDTAALVAEVAHGRLRAALDVTDPEPLPRSRVSRSGPPPRAARVRRSSSREITVRWGTC